HDAAHDGSDIRDAAAAHTNANARPRLHAGSEIGRPQLASDLTWNVVDPAIRKVLTNKIETGQLHHVPSISITSGSQKAKNHSAVNGQQPATISVRSRVFADYSKCPRLCRTTSTYRRWTTSASRWLVIH